MGSFSIWHWIIVLVIVLLVFGTKRLTSGARDVGKAVDDDNGRRVVCLTPSDRVRWID